MEPNEKKPSPTCPLCQGQKHRREVVQVFDESASQKRKYVALVCKRCSHVLIFSGGSNLFALD